MSDTNDEKPATIGERLDRIAEAVETGINHDDVSEVVGAIDKLADAVRHLDNTIWQVSGKSLR